MKTPVLLVATLIALLGLVAKAQQPPVLPEIPSRFFNVTNYGAIGDGAMTNTEAIQVAINSASNVGGGIVEIPAGVYLSGPVQLANHINLRVDAGAVLRMLPLEKYPGGTAEGQTFIGGTGLHDVAVSGAGMIDGQGLPWWPFANAKGARRPRMIALSTCERVLIERVTLTNSPMFHIAINGRSANVTVRGVTIRANPSTDPVNPGHNTDACDVSGKHVLIQDCDVSVGDDNFTCGGNTSDVLITNCTYGYGHGVSIGSYTSGGVSNITVVNCTFNNTESGIRIKTDRDRGGYVHNMNYLNLRMTNVGCPILVYASYMATNREYRNLNNLTAAVAAGYPAKEIGPRTPAYRDFTFSNITAVAESGRRAGLIWGLPELNATNILLQNVTITADKPFGIYDAQNVRLVNCKFITPDGGRLDTTNSQITVSAR